MSTGFVREMSAGLCAVVLIAVTAAAAEPKDQNDIPKVVMNALKARFPKAKIDKWTKEKEDGKEVYDIEFKQDGKKLEADIFADGAIHNWEREFAAKDLPKAVTDAVEKKYPNSAIREVMEITEVKDKKETHGGFEIVLKTAEKKSVEVTVAKNGKILEDSSEEE